MGVVLLTAGAAVAQTATQDAADKSKAAAQRTGDAVSDSAITAAVKSRFAADTAVSASKIDVDTDKGVVTVSGHVASAAERAQALRLARDTKGVARVVDKLTVGTAATSGRVDAKKDETTIVIKDDTTPAVKKGAAKTKEVSKDIAGKTADVAKDVAGKTADGAKKVGKAVKDTKVVVKDDTKVEVKKDDGDPTVRTAGEATTDAAITTAVKTKLIGDKAVSGTKINVDTSKGVVTLTGEVATPAEKAEAVRLARTTNGVKSVVDRLTVK